MDKDLISLVDFINGKKELGEEPKYEIDYIPDKRTARFSANEVGISAEEQEFFRIPKQVFQTEDFVYYPIVDEHNDPYLVSKSVTQQQLYMCGSNLEYRIKLIKRVCSLYNSRELKSKGILIIEELIKMLPSYLIKTDHLYDHYYINKTYVDVGEVFKYNEIGRYRKTLTYDGYLYTCNNGKIESERMYGTGSAMIVVHASIRPVIKLPKDIMIDTSEIGIKKLTLYK